VNNPSNPQTPHRSYKYYDFLLAGFVTVLLCSNLIGAGKAAQVQLPLFGNVIFGAGVLFFPISYAFGNIFTEVYGYAYDRRAVWCGFGALLFAVIMSQIVINLTPAPGDSEGLRTRKLTEAFLGDLVVIGGAGAYCAGLSTKNYNSYPEAPEILRDKKGEVHLIR
jgi:uncharacterized PurR-regulated membrane protein YhhQ (DUF165 family)